MEQLPYNHIYRNPDYEVKELKVKDVTEKSKSAWDVTECRLSRKDSGDRSVDSEKLV